MLIPNSVMYSAFYYRRPVAWDLVWLFGGLLSWCDVESIDTAAGMSIVVGVNDSLWAGVDFFGA